MYNSMMSDIPRPALGQPVSFGGRAFLILTLIITAIFIGMCIAQYESADAASLGYTVPSGLSEHTNYCYARQPVTESGTPSNTELWLYWITDQNADFCNLSQARQEEQKSSEESLRTEVKSVSSDTSALKAELESVKTELVNLKKVEESVNENVTGIGAETKPLYVRTPPTEPASKVEVADFTAGAQTDLSEMQTNVETVGFFVIGTMIAAMLSAFLYMILRPKR